MTRGRPREPMALKIAKGKKHLSKEEMTEIEDEVYAAEGDIVPPEWLNGMALQHFEKQARYMRALNEKAGRNVYGDLDSEALTLMSVSFQKSNEYLLEEQKAKKRGDAKAQTEAHKKRLAEDRSYREFMKLLKLDPGSRVDINGREGDGDEDEDEF